MKTIIQASVITTLLLAANAQAQYENDGMTGDLIPVPSVNIEGDLLDPADRMLELLDRYYEPFPSQRVLDIRSRRALESERLESEFDRVRNMLSELEIPTQQLSQSLIEKVPLLTPSKDRPMDRPSMPRSVEFKGDPGPGPTRSVQRLADATSLLPQGKENLRVIRQALEELESLIIASGKNP